MNMSRQNIAMDFVTLFCSSMMVTRAFQERSKRFGAGVICLSLALAPAHAQTQTETNPTPTSVQVPLKMRQGDIMVETRVNGSEPLSFKLDTGFGITTIHPDLVDTLKLTRNGQMTIVGIAGEEHADTYSGASFDLGGWTYSPRRVAVLPSEGQRRRRRRDGILGSSFFRRFVVELDFKSHQLTLHEPASFNYSGSGDILPIFFKHDTPIIDAAIQVDSSGEAVPCRCEIDTGCDDCLCFGQEFVTEHKLIRDDKNGGNGSRRGVGGSAEIQSGTLHELRIGKQVVKTPSANFFLEGSPAGEGQAGHIGLGVLQHYKVILDYSRKQMILEPQS